MGRVGVVTANLVKIAATAARRPSLATKAA
jgi:hypothetical protein